MSSPQSTLTHADHDALRRAADWLAAADSLVISAGAGMGVDSGLPDFRGTEGFWRAYPALRASGQQFADIANPEAFRRDPARAWGFYGHRLGLYRATVPHAGFQILKRWADAKPQGAFVFTSNVDGQFQKAGFPEACIEECHGSIHHLQCLTPCTADIWRADALIVDIDTENCRLRSQPPRCPHCGELARPNILMFGDWGWLPHRSYEQAARRKAWLKNVQNPVVIELGAGTAIPSVRRFGEQLSAPLIRINARESEVAGEGVGISLSALSALSALDQLMTRY